MATTALKIMKDGLAIRVKYMTVPVEKGLHIDIYNCNEKFIPVGDPHFAVDDRDEDTYHKELRIESNKRGQFVKEESTNPEWNPE